MSTLYELADEYNQILELMEDDTIDEQTIQDTLEGIEGELEDKADSIAKLIKQAKADAKMIDDEVKRLQSRKKTILSNAERLKNYLESAMVSTGKKKFKTALFGFTVGKNAPSVVIDDVMAVPEVFWKQKDPELDKVALKEFLKNPDNDGVTFAHLESTESLKIR